MWIGKDRNKTAEPIKIQWVKKVHALGIFFSYDTDSVIQKNFMDRAKEFKRILDMWQQRDLSIIGKIIILKSLAFSKVLYQCGVMAPPQDFITTLNDIAYDFVWGYKPEKIKRLTLISEYEQGGQKMLDIESFLKAQKAMWVKRLLSPDVASWKALPNLFLKGMLGNNTFRCNMNCKEKPINFPDFYWHVLKYWFEAKEITQKPSTPFNIRRECLWLNKNIKVNNNELKGALWHNSGINIIHDIVNENGKFLTTAEIETKFGIKCDTLKYNTLKDAIPLEWRKVLQSMKIPQEAISFQETLALNIQNRTINIDNITNKDIYWIFVRNIQKKPIITERSWQKLEITDEQWKEIFTIPSTIRDTKIKAFQYKLLFNLVPCNVYLNKIKKSDTDKCDTCQELDDITHYIFGCIQVSLFWKSFTQWWNNWTKENIKLNKQQILVGILGNKLKNKLLNACILLGKWHIYKHKLDQSDIFFYKFQCELKYYLMIEKTIALRNNKLNLYTSLWQSLEDTLT
jgi:hypothetical protein